MCLHNDTFEDEGYTTCLECGEIFGNGIVFEKAIKHKAKRREIDIYSKIPDNIPAETKYFACLIHRKFCINSGCETRDKKIIASCLYLGGIMAEKKKPLEVCARVMGVKQTKHFQDKLNSVASSLGFSGVL